jgi:hypothetical protein
MKEFAMPGIKQAFLGSAAVAALACAPMAPAAAGVHGFGHVHPFGLGRGLFGAVLGLATLPIAIASAALSAGADAPQPGYAAQPGYAPQPGYAAQPAYVPRPAYYPAPQTYYAPPAAYYPRAPVYYPQPRAYYAAPPAYYAPRANYAPRPAYYGGYGGRVSYRSGGYAYPHR